MVIQSGTPHIIPFMVLLLVRRRRRGRRDCNTPLGCWGTSAFGDALAKKGHGALRRVSVWQGASLESNIPSEQQLGVCALDCHSVHACELGCQGQWFMRHTCLWFVLSGFLMQLHRMSQRGALRLSVIFAHSAQLWMAQEGGPVLLRKQDHHGRTCIGALQRAPGQVHCQQQR